MSLLERLPAFEDILEAREVIARHPGPTPFRHEPLVSELVGAEVWIRYENHQPTGSFKIGGARNLVSRFDEGPAPGRDSYTSVECLAPERIHPFRSRVRG